MAYDDDDGNGKFDFRDWYELEAVLRDYFSTPENISFARLRSAIDVLARVSAQGDVRKLTLLQVDEAVRNGRMGDLPFSVVVGLLQAVAKHPKDAASRMTVRELENVLVEARRR
jgi:uncharacterized protein YhdP